MDYYFDIQRIIKLVYLNFKCSSIDFHNFLLI